MPDTGALERFLERLEAASSGPVEGWPELLRLPAARPSR
jgi:hypothetical protein